METNVSTKCPPVVTQRGCDFAAIFVLAGYLGALALLGWSLYRIGGIPALVCMIVFPLVSGAFANTSRRPRPSSDGESQGQSVGTISRR